MKGQSSNLAVCSFELNVNQGEPTQLLPHGEFRGTDGQPKNAPHFQMNAAIAKRVIDKVSARDNDLVIDYEHQTLLSAENGKPAPAAGWWHDMEYIDGEGLFATTVDWTEDASTMIAKKQYKYISLVFPYDEEGRPTDIYHAGLTNFPAIDGMEEVTLMAAKRFQHDDSTEDDSMNKELLKLLGLNEDATADDAIAALKAITGLNVVLLEGVGLKVEATEEEAQTAIAALKASIDTAEIPDPAKFVSVSVVEEMKTELATLKSIMNNNEATVLIDSALADGRLTAAQKGWAEDLAKSDIAALKKYVGSATPIPALLQKQTSLSNAKFDPEAALSESDIAICKNLGISQEDFKKTRQAEAESS
ncbi:MAG: hypothetical protein GKR93_11990 [Gammaproteobacteria bacterium]|nr:hypothetical protein [Gammaproteobacteria bacterium]